MNLIPADAPGRSGAAGRSGGAVYVLLGVLAALVVGVGYYVMTSNAIVDRRAELSSLRTQAQAAQAAADATQPYREFASLAQARVQTIRQLGAARFDWNGALADLAKVIPDNVWLTSMLGTVTTGVSVQGASSGSTGSLRSALPNPAIELTGCTTDQDSVVRLLSRLRLVAGVQRVALADSSKATTSGASSGGGGGATPSGGGGGSAGGGDCRHGHSNFPQFDVVVFFAPLPAVPAPPGAAGAGGATSAVAATSAGAAQPASSPSATSTPAPSGAASSGSDVR